MRFRHDVDRPAGDRVVGQSLRVDFRRYRRPFRSPLITSHGTWSVREGIIVRLQDAAGRVGWGEVAPLPWFGTEMVEAAIAFLASLDGAIALGELGQVDDGLPCCQFALGCAGWMLAQGEDLSETRQQFMPRVLDPARVAGLIPMGEAALRGWSRFYGQGHRVLKWKVTGDPRGLDIFATLVAQLPPDIVLRLDANGGLSRSLATDWLRRCDELPPGRIDCLEQPLPPEDIPGLRDLSQTFRTPIALDESVATIEALRAIAQGGWDGMAVLKPAIAGYPQGLFVEGFPQVGRPVSAQPPRLQPWLRRLSGVVISSVFETPVGQWGALRIASLLGAQHPGGDRALGFGTDPWLVPLRSHWLEHLWAGDDPFETELDAG